MPARYYVSYHTVKEGGWYRVGGSLDNGDDWWWGFIRPTDPKTGNTIASDGWSETWTCGTRPDRIPAPFPVDSPHGANVHPS